MQMLVIVSLYFFLAACSTIGTGVDAFRVSELGKAGLPKFSQDKGNQLFKTIEDPQYSIGDKLFCYHPLL